MWSSAATLPAALCSDLDNHPHLVGNNLRNPAPAERNHTLVDALFKISSSSDRAWVRDSSASCPACARALDLGHRFVRLENLDRGHTHNTTMLRSLSAKLISMEAVVWISKFRP